MELLFQALDELDDLVVAARQIVMRYRRLGASVNARYRRDLGSSALSWDHCN
jgi:hypothetical protein